MKSSSKLIIIDTHMHSEKTKAGLVVAHKSQDVADGLAKLINEKDLSEELSKNGRRAVLEQYSREKAAFKMYIIINKILKEKAQEIVCNRSNIFRICYLNYTRNTFLGLYDLRTRALVSYTS